METTFIQDARRTQLVDVAIEMLAEVGADRASLVRIAERAGVSRGVVAYHFGSRRGLFAAVVDEVYAVGARAMSTAVHEASTPRLGLEQLVRRSVGFYADHPRHLAALGAIYTSHSPDAPSRDERPEHAREMADLAGLLRDGQVAGLMRDFDVTLMALTVRAVLDTAVGLVRGGADPGPLGDELWRTLDAATRAEHAR